MSNGERILELMDELGASLGEEVLGALRSLGWSVYTLQANYRDLQAALSFIEQSPEGESLMPLRNRDRLHQALREVIRLLHNFVASAKALEDHTRVLRKRMHQKPSLRMHRDPQQDAAVQDLIQQLFIQDPLAQFIQELRDYTTHHELPGVTYSIGQVSPEAPVTRAVTVSAQALLDTWDWKRRSRVYMETHGPNISLSESIAEYEAKVREFYTVLEDRYRALYADEIAQRNQMEWELSILWLEDNVTMQTDGGFGLRDDVFVQLFGSAEFDELESVPDGLERGEMAIEIASRYGALPHGLVQAITRLYGGT